MKPVTAVLAVIAALFGGLLLGYRSGGRQVSPGAFWVIIAASVGFTAWNRWRRSKRQEPPPGPR